MSTQLHQGQPVLAVGKPLDAAKAVMIMIHGRGASAESILSLVPEIEEPDFAFIAPQAAGGTWYPYPFMEPVERNEPYLSSALAVITGLVDQVLGQGFVTQQIMLLGFSQGACLVSEWAVRNPKRYGAVIALSGGLIGDKLVQPLGSFDDAIFFFGCSDTDSHIPKSRVEESAAIVKAMGGDVIKRLYPKMGHTINHDETAFIHGVMTEVVRGENR